MDKDVGTEGVGTAVNVNVNVNVNVSAPLRVLHIEDVPQDVELVQAVLQRADLPAEIERVETEAELVAALACDFDIILADYSLPSFDGMRALEIARRLRPEIPFLFVTGALKDDSAVESLRLGATDFIVKQRLGRLVPAVRRALREAEERHERMRAEASLKLLVDAGALLPSTLDMRATMHNVARLAVPQIADWCIVSLRPDEEEGTAGAGTTHATMHADADKLPLLQALVERAVDAPCFLAPTARDVEEEHLIADVTDAVLRARVQDELAGDLIRRLGTRSLMVLPLRANRRRLGSLTLVVGASRRPYSEREHELARAFADRAALALENGRLCAELKRAVQTRDEMAAIVSHDLRNPLGSITTAAAMIADDDAPRERVKGWAESIGRSARRMMKLTSDLLDLASLDSRTLKLELATHNVSDILQECVDAQAPTATMRGIRLSYKGAANLGARCDRDRIVQVVSNLIGNALKFTPTGGTVTVAAELDGARVRVSVADTGRGIPLADQPHIFDRYWQARRARGSVGLGLFIVKALIDAHGGEVRVHSRPGEGACFTFTLHAAQDRVAVTAPTVMVIDDDPDIRATLTEVLGAAGYVVVTAADGHEALEQLRTQPTQLILLDLCMPRMDGQQFRRHQRALSELATIPTVVITATSTKWDDVVEPAAYLRKPLQVSEVLAVIEKLVGSHACDGP